MKKLIVSILSISILLSLVACTNTTKPVTATAPATAVAATPEPAKKVTITFANIWIKEEMNGFTYPLDMIEAYDKTNDNVTVVFDSQPDYQNTYFKSMVAAGTLPQLFLLNSMDITSTVSNNMLLDLTDRMTSDKEWYDSFLPGLFNETTRNGKIYAVPWQFITNEVIFYNTEIVKAMGYDGIPADWEGYMALCAKLKTAGYIPIIHGDKDGWPLCSNLMEIMCEYMCGPEWVDNIGAFNGKSSYDSPDFVAVLNLIKNVIDKGYFNADMLSIGNFDEANPYMYNKKGATSLTGSYGLQSMLSGASDEMKKLIAVAPIPRPAAAKAETKPGMYTGGSGWEIAINAKTTSPEEIVACMDIVKLLTSPEKAKNDVEAMRIPVLKMDKVVGWDPAKVPALQSLMNQSISKAPVIRLMNQEQSGPAMSEVIYKKLQEMAIGSVTPEQVAKDIQAVYEKVRTSMK